MIKKTNIKCIYLISSTNPNYNQQYIGSTKNFKQRISNHKNCSKNEIKQKLELYSFINLVGWNNIKFTIIEDIEENKNKQYFLERERHYINLLKPKLNMVIPLRTKLEYMNENKKSVYMKRNIQNVKRRNNNNKISLNYYYNNKERICQQRKEYRKKAKKELSIKLKTKYNCCCGAEITLGSKPLHLKSNKHAENLKLNLLNVNLKYSYKNIDIRL